MLIHAKEETLRVIFLPSFLKADAQKSSYGVKRTSNLVAGNSHVDMSSTLKVLNKLYRLFLFIVSYWE